MARTLRERPLSIVPLLVTQLNCEAVIGVNGRRYLESIVPRFAGHVIAIGKLRAIPADVLLERLRGLPSPSAEEPIETADDDKQPETADGVLRAIGLRRSA